MLTSRHYQRSKYAEGLRQRRTSVQVSGSGCRGGRCAVTAITIRPVCPPATDAPAPRSASHQTAMRKALVFVFDSHDTCNITDVPSERLHDGGGSASSRQARKVPSWRLAKCQISARPVLATADGGLPMPKPCFVMWRRESHRIKSPKRGRDAKIGDMRRPVLRSRTPRGGPVRITIPGRV